MYNGAFAPLLKDLLGSNIQRRNWDCLFWHPLQYQIQLGTQLGVLARESTAFKVSAQSDALACWSLLLKTTFNRSAPSYWEGVDWREVETTRVRFRLWPAAGKIILTYLSMTCLTLIDIDQYWLCTNRAGGTDAVPAPSEHLVGRTDTDLADLKTLGITFWWKLQNNFDWFCPLRCFQGIVTNNWLRTEHVIESIGQDIRLCL